MLDYLIAASIIGCMGGLVFSVVYLAETLDANTTPREVIGGMALTFFGWFVSAVFFPVLIVAGLLHLIVSLINNDWAWYKK
jgi:hypothetical protein